MLLLVLTGLTLLSAPPGPAWDWPLAGAPAVDRPFERPRTTYGAGHRGVDLSAQTGSPVLAAGAGTVTYVGLLAGRGVVTVSHPGGLRTTYEPVAASVVLGQVVRLGSRLGRVTTGHASCRLGTTCLHWGLLRGASYVDPLSLLGRTRVRLLPLGQGPAAGLPVDAPATPVLPLSRTGPRARRADDQRTPSQPSVDGSSALVAGVTAAAVAGLSRGRRRRTGGAAREPRARRGRFGT